MKITVTQERIGASDSVLLDTYCYLPEKPKNLSAILFRTPYGKQNFSAIIDPLTVVKMGFALIIQDVRGRFQSSGKFEPFINEQNDGIETISWIRSQPWSNGNIFTIGVSYEGFTAMMSSHKRNITAMAPIMSSPYIERDWFFENGCIKQAFVQSWSHSFAFTDNGEMLSKTEIDETQRLANDLMCLYKGSLYRFPVAKYLPYYNSWIDPTNQEYWHNISCATSIAPWEVSGYYISGWYDIFCEGTLKCFWEVLQKTTLPQKLVVGPWSHTQFITSVVGDVDFGVYTLENYSALDILQWFQSIEDKQVVQTCIQFYFMGINKWVALQQMPKIRQTQLYLQIDNRPGKDPTEGVLTWNEPVTSGVMSFYFNSQDLVPTCGGRCIDALPAGQGGPKIQNQIENRADVLVYTSNKVTESLAVMGEIRIWLVSKSSLGQMDYAIKITDVDEKGNSINILDSCLRIKEDANVKTQKCLSVGTIAHVFLPGHCIRCDISSSNFPRINVQEEILDCVAENCIFTGGNEPSFVELPIVDLEILNG